MEFCEINALYPANRVCFRTLSQVTSCVDALTAWGFEVSKTIPEGFECGFPERDCNFCGRALLRLDTLPGGELTEILKILHGQTNLVTPESLTDVLPNTELARQSNNGYWTTRIKYRELRCTGCSKSGHYADVLALAQFYDLIRSAHDANPVHERTDLVARVVDFLGKRIKPGNPYKALVLQAVTTFAPGFPIVQHCTAGGASHAPCFVIELDWMGYSVMYSSRAGETRRAAEETAFQQLVAAMLPRLLGGALDPDDECCICLQAFSADPDLVEFPCGHGMHNACHLQWRAAVDQALRCPMCRYLVDGPPLPLRPAVVRPVNVLRIPALREMRALPMIHANWFTRITGINMHAVGFTRYGPTFGNVDGLPCGLSAILCILAAVAEIPRTYAGILLDHGAILQADRHLLQREREERISAAATRRQQAALDLWRARGYGNRVTPEELAPILIELNLAVGILAVDALFGPEGPTHFGFRRLLRDPAAAIGNTILEIGSIHRPRMEIFYLPFGINGAHGHFVGVDMARAYHRSRAAFRRQPVPEPFVPMRVPVDGRFGTVAEADWPVYHMALAQAAAAIYAMPDRRNNRYHAMAPPGRLVMGPVEIAIPAPGIDIAAVGGDFADVPVPPAPLGLVNPVPMGLVGEPAEPALPDFGLEALFRLPMPMPAEDDAPAPAPEPEVVDADDDGSDYGLDALFRLPMPIEPAPEDPEGAFLDFDDDVESELGLDIFDEPEEEEEEEEPEPAWNHPPFEVPTALPFDPSEAVLISTVTCDALPIHWVRVPTKYDTRRVHRFDRPDVCTCHFSMFQVVPCKHIRRAKVLVLGPGFERALGGNMLFGLGILWLKKHYYVTMQGGAMRLTMVKNRACWVDPAGFGTNNAVYVNPAGPLTAVHYGSHAVALGEPVVSVSPQNQDGSVAVLVSPLSRALYWEAGAGAALESLCEETSIVQGTKGALLGAVFGFACDVLMDPAQLVMLGLINAWNAQAALMHMGFLKISLGVHTIGALLAKIVLAMHIPVLGQVFLAGFLGLCIKVGLYKAFRDRLGIGGIWADIGFLTTFGLHAIPVFLVRLMLTPGLGVTLEHGVDETLEAWAPPAQPELIAATDAVVGYANSRMLMDPAIFRAAATGLINFNRAAHLLPPHAFERLVAIESNNCAMRLRLEGSGVEERDANGEFHGVVPPRGACMNYPHCKEKLVKKGRGRNFSLCPRCLGSHCNRPGREFHNEMTEAVLDGVRVTGQIPLLCMRSHYYESPDETQVFIPPGCELRTNMRNDETKHPDFCRTRKIGVGVGYVHPGWTVDHQHSGISAVVMGLMERTFQYGEPYDERAVDWYCRMVNYNASKTPDGEVDKMDDLDWLKSQERCFVLTPAMIDLRRGTGLLKEDLEIGVFTKSEWFCKTKLGLGAFGPSKRRAGYKKRGIYTPADKAHCAVGPWSKPIQKHIAEVFNSESPFFYAGKATPAELNKFLLRVVEAFPTSHVLMADIARCETNKHFRVVAARMRYYRRKWSREDADRDRVIYSWKNARFKARCGNGRASGKLPPNMTLSGEDFTSADNSFDVANATMLLVYCALENVQPSALTEEHFRACCGLWEEENVFGAGSGDDTTVVIPRVYRGQDVDQATFLERYKQYAIELGFKVTGMWSRAVWDIVFLGMRPYHCSDGLYRFGKLIGRSSVKNHFARQLEGHPYDWLMEVCKAESITMPHVPLLWHKAERVRAVLKPRIGSGRPLRKNDLHELHKSAGWLKVDGQGVTFTEQTWQDLAECYGLTVDLLKGEVDRINKAEWFPYALSGEVWERIFAVDLSY